MRMVESRIEGEADEISDGERGTKRRNLERLCWAEFGVWPWNDGGAKRNIIGWLRVNVSI